MWAGKRVDPHAVTTPRAPAATVQGDVMEGDVQESSHGYCRLDCLTFFQGKFSASCLNQKRGDESATKTFEHPWSHLKNWTLLLCILQRHLQNADKHTAENKAHKAAGSDQKCVLPWTV